MDFKKIDYVEVKGLQGTSNYKVDFRDDQDTVIIIAPNGFGKTALLSLLRDCLTLDIEEVEKRSFTSIKIQFVDETSWIFERDDSQERKESSNRRPAKPSALPFGIFSGSRGGKFFVRNEAFKVSFKIFDNENKLIKQFPVKKMEDDDGLDGIPRSIDSEEFFFDKMIEDFEGKDDENTAIEKEFLYERFRNNSIRNRFMFKNRQNLEFFEGLKLKCLFIETQRLLYNPSKDDHRKQLKNEEVIARQAERLSSLLDKTYSDYASESQKLDRLFPGTLISAMKEGELSDPDVLRRDLETVEKKRASLTEAGILIDPGDKVIPKIDSIEPQISKAIEIYVKDSKQKLRIYDEIYAKISVFMDLMEKKLNKKRIFIDRRDGVKVEIDGAPLNLESLSSGEKHEFVMLFKLIFDTPKNSIVLIDEPEISLHVVWQLEFMEDLRKIQKINPFQCMIATHSPQIFQGSTDIVIDLADQA